MRKDELGRKLKEKEVELIRFLDREDKEGVVKYIRAETGLRQRKNRTIYMDVKIR